MKRNIMLLVGLLVCGLLAASKVSAFPEPANYSGQPWGKVEFIAFQTEGLSNGFVYEVRSGKPLAFVSKQAVLFLRRTVAIELGGVGDLSVAAFGIGPSLNVAEFFSLFPVLKKLPILKKSVVGYFFGYSPDGIEIGPANVAHWVHGPRGGFQWRF